jgi:hypothetical protein
MGAFDCLYHDFRAKGSRAQRLGKFEVWPRKELGKSMQVCGSGTAC